MTGRCNWAVAATHASPSPALCALQPCTWLATDPWFFGISPSHILYFSLSYFVFLWFIFCISLFHILYFEIHYLFSFSNFVLIVFWIVGACALTGLLCPTTLHLAGNRPLIFRYFSKSYFVFLSFIFCISLVHILYFFISYFVFWDSLSFFFFKFCTDCILNCRCVCPHRPFVPYNPAPGWHTIQPVNLLVFLHVIFCISPYHIFCFSISYYFFWDSPYCILMFCICSILNFACMRHHQPCMPHNSAHCWHPSFYCSTI